MNVPTEWGQEAIERYAVQAGEGIATLVIGWLVAKLIASGLRRVLRRARVDTTVATFGANMAYVTMLALVVIAALDKFGFPTVSFAAVVGAAGLAIGLALKGTLSNLAAGVILAAVVSGLMVRRRLDHLDLVAVLKTRE